MGLTELKGNMQLHIPTHIQSLIVSVLDTFPQCS